MKEQTHIIGANSTIQNNKLWWWSKRNKKPFLAIKKKQKYAHIDYDMWTINYNLNEEAQSKLKQLRDEAVKRNFDLGGKKSVWSSIGYSSGIVADILKPVAFEMYPYFEAIIFDENNWVSIEETKKRS